MRFSTGSGWGLVRVSNTEPCLTVRAEAHTGAELRTIVDEMIAALAEMPVDIALEQLRDARATL